MAKIIINKANFYHNLNQIALKTGSKEKIAIVLKDNAYGHGLKIMAALASEFGLTHAVVRNLHEADLVREKFDDILVLGDRAVPDRQCVFTLNSLKDIARAKPGARVELKVDTGMHRNGIAMDEVEEALAQIKVQKLELVGVMTHFRAADEMSSEFFWQKKHFESVKTEVRSAGFSNIRFHSHNSAAILRCSRFDEDLVRVGIAAYGYDELPNPFTPTPLKPVMQLVASKVATRRLKKGERVGYGGDFAAPRDMTVSTYDLGYGDGWCRGNTFAPFVTAEGLPILGRVSMDFITLESEKDEVVVFDDAQAAAKQLGTISYEVMTALSRDIPRVVV
ncbi:Alanine racemase [hydrothermal vent metagenome]|uniref:Alanine racemase n=1 Tax=hydrothermal vent metagenome TaxID=652676 RepID=A0A1W1EAL6_9ZZZZ